MAILESFAVIVGLICQFKAERSSNKEPKLEEFKSWLEIKGLTDITDQLANNQKTTISIKAILNQDHNWIKDKLTKIDSALTSFTSSIEEFQELAKNTNPNAVLSEQALSILKQFDSSGASKAIESKTLDGASYCFFGARGSIAIEDERFLEDDLYTLIELGLLRLDYGSNGNRIFIYTRAAAGLIS